MFRLYYGHCTTKDQDWATIWWFLHTDNPIWSPKIFTCPYIKQSEYFDVKCLQMQGAICADKRDFQKMCARKYKVCKQNVNMNRIVHIRGVCDQKIIPTQERRHCLIASHSSQRLNILQCRWHNNKLQYNMLTYQYFAMPLT